MHMIESPLLWVLKEMYINLCCWWSLFKGNYKFLSLFFHYVKPHTWLVWHDDQQLNPLGSLLILWSDNLSDHTSLLSDIQLVNIWWLTVMIVPGPWSCEIKLQQSEVVDAIVPLWLQVCQITFICKHTYAHTYIATCICLQYTW